MMGEHTPTPWKFIDATKEASMQYKPLCVIQSGEKQIASFSWNDSSPWFPTKLESQANAAFIVKAVNAHDALVTELKLIADWRNVSLAGEYEHSLRDIIRSMLDCADRALASIKVPS